MGGGEVASVRRGRTLRIFMPDSLCFLHLIADKVFAKDKGAGIQLPVNESQKRRVREGAAQDHLQGLMFSSKRRTKFGALGFEWL